MQVGTVINLTLCQCLAQRAHTRSLAPTSAPHARKGLHVQTAYIRSVQLETFVIQILLSLFLAHLVNAASLEILLRLAQPAPPQSKAKKSVLCAPKVTFVLKQTIQQLNAPTDTTPTSLEGQPAPYARNIINATPRTFHHKLVMSGRIHF